MTPGDPRPVVHVVAGAVMDAAGRVLIAQRPAGKHLAGGWEFPGGKLEPREGRAAGLARELREELGITIAAPSRCCGCVTLIPPATCCSTCGS